MDAISVFYPSTLVRFDGLGQDDELSAAGEVLGLLASGRRSPDIARSLGISVATVEVHRRNIMRKLGLHTIAELTKYAVRKGLTPL